MSFNCFSSWVRVPARSAVKRPQGVHWRRFRFYLSKLRRDTVVLISAEVQDKHRSRGRCAQAGRDLRTYQLRLRDWRIVVAKKVHRDGSSSTLKYLEDHRKECVQKTPWRPELRRKIRRVRAFESFKRKQESQVVCKSHISEKDRRVDFEPEVLEEEIERLEFSEENSRNSEDRRIQESCRGS